MHTVWKGSISFGLVNIPVRMFTATEERDIRFRQLHDACHTPIRYAKICPTCDREVQQSELIRGYEYEKGNFVIIKDEDIEKITPETRKAVEILDFVDLSEIDPIFFDKSYFLSPQETGDKAYSLLRAAMEHTGKIAIARITLRNRESLAVLRIFQNCLVLETIYYPDEVRAVDKVPALPAGDFKVADNELRMAEQLVESMSAPFEPSKYTDTYREDLHRMIQQKLEGQEVTAAPAAAKTNVIDLMAALQASIAAAGGDETPAVGVHAGTDTPVAGVVAEADTVAAGTGEGVGAESSVAAIADRADAEDVPLATALARAAESAGHATADHADGSGALGIIGGEPPAETKPKKTTSRRKTTKKAEPAVAITSPDTGKTTAIIDENGKLKPKPAREVVERYPSPRAKQDQTETVETTASVPASVSETDSAPVGQVLAEAKDDGTTVTKKLRRKKTTTTT